MRQRDVALSALFRGQIMSSCRATNAKGARQSDLEAVKRERDEARALADSYANGEVITKGIADRR